MAMWNAWSCADLCYSRQTYIHTSSHIQAYGDEDYLVFDCPGQIELYSHLGTFRF